MSLISRPIEQLRTAPWFPHKISGTIRGLYRDPGQVRFLPDWLLAWRYRNPINANIPWISFEAREAIEQFLKSLGGRATVYEYGSGGSTLWYAQRSAKVISVEHDQTWFEIMDRKIRDGAANCRLSFVPPVSDVPRPVPNTNGWVTYGSTHSGNYEAYVRSIDEFADGSFDFVAIDGRSRPACLVHAATKVRPGGAVYLDDADRSWYAPVLSAFSRWERQDLGGLRPLDFPNYGVLLRRPDSGDDSLDFAPEQVASSEA